MILQIYIYMTIYSVSLLPERRSKVLEWGFEAWDFYRKKVGRLRIIKLAFKAKCRWFGCQLHWQSTGFHRGITHFKCRSDDLARWEALSNLVNLYHLVIISCIFQKRSCTSLVKKCPQWSWVTINKIFIKMFTIFDVIIQSVKLPTNDAFFLHHHS